MYLVLFAVLPLAYFCLVWIILLRLNLCVGSGGQAEVEAGFGQY